MGPPRTISTSVIILTAMMTICVVGGWRVLPPRCLPPPPGRILRGIATGSAAAVAIVGAGAAAVVAIDGMSKDVDGRRAAAIYEPPSGSMEDRVVLVTGGSSGLGLETVKRLAAAGATVVLTSRTEAKGRMAVEVANEYLVRRGGKSPTRASIYNIVLDLDDLSDVMLVPSRYEALGLERDISVLINNAGVMAIPQREITVDGNERTFQSNHLGHFVLTSALFPYLSRDGARIVTVSSSASYFAGPDGLDLDNINGQRSYGPWPSYSSSKLANVLFTRELQRRADDAGHDWLSAATLHPGVVDTDLWRYVVGEEKLARMKDGRDILGSLALGATRLFAKTPEEGASTQVYLAATSDAVVKGAFYEEMSVKVDLPWFAKDDAKAKALWDASEELGRVRFDLTAAAATVGGAMEDVEFSAEESSDSSLVLDNAEDLE